MPRKETDVWDEIFCALSPFSPAHSFVPGPPVINIHLELVNEFQNFETWEGEGEGGERKGRREEEGREEEREEGESQEPPMDQIWSWLGISLSLSLPRSLAPSCICRTRRECA